MKRRQVIIFGLAAALSGPAFASSFEDEIVASLCAQGYERITVEKTLLGRIKITAFKMSNQREIVINPRTGEILRDLWLTADGQVATNAPNFDDLDAKNDTGNSGADDDTAGDDSSGNGNSSDSGSGNTGSDDSDDDNADDTDDDSSDGPDDDRSDSDSDGDSGGDRD